MFTIRKNLSARAGAPPNTRVNPDTGVVETTMDDGATWVDDPNSDPRQNPAYRLPPPTATDVKCAAAAGMVENVRRVVDGAAGGTTVAGIATILLTLLLIPGIGWMFAAMLLFAEAFITAGSAAVVAAFTEDVYDFLLCSFYENIDADGRVSWAQLEAVQAAAAAEFPDPLVGDILAGIMQMHREVGFTNAGVVYADDMADCGVCNPCGAEYLYSAGEPAGAVFTLFAGTFATDKIQQVCTGGAGSTSTLNYGQLLTPPCEYALAEADIEVIGLSADWYIYGIKEDDPSSTELDLLASGTASVGVSTVGGAVTPLAPYYGLRVIVDTPTGCGAADVYVTAIRANEA